MKPKDHTIAVIANAAAFSGGDWEMVAPYGEHPTSDGKRIQSFGKTEAQAMVATFNSLWHKLGTGFRGVPIFHGHPDVDPVNWSDDRRLGKATALEAREDGLWCKPEWNALGADNAREGWWIYPSPAWLHDKTNARVVKPDELLSIGMVNTPNISGSQPWANSVDPEAKPETKDIMKNELCALYGLDPATATDEEIIAAAKAAKTAADAETNAAQSATDEKAAKEEALRKLGEANSAKTAAEKRVKETIALCARTIVANAIIVGSVTEADREATTNSFTADGADIEKLAKELGERKPEMNTGFLDLGGRKVAISTSRQRQDAIQTEVNARMAGGVDYTTAYNAVKRDPKFKQLFDSMKKPGETEG